MRDGAIEGAVSAFSTVFRENVTDYGTGSAPTRAVLRWFEEFAESTEELGSLQRLWMTLIEPTRRDMGESTVDGTPIDAPFNPDDIEAALDRLRATVFSATDEARKTGTISRAMARNISLLGADVLVIHRRQTMTTLRKTP